MLEQWKKGIKSINDFSYGSEANGRKMNQIVMIRREVKGDLFSLYFLWTHSRR
jgi:hypothetical protein